MIASVHVGVAGDGVPWTTGPRREAAVVEDFAEFVRMALPGLLRYGHALTGNPHDAADLVQGVLEKVGSRWNSVLGKGPDPLAYVRRAMANGHVSRGVVQDHAAEFGEDLGGCGGRVDSGRDQGEVPERE